MPFNVIQPHMPFSAEPLQSRFSGLPQSPDVQEPTEFRWVDLKGLAPQTDTVRRYANHALTRDHEHTESPDYSDSTKSRDERIRAIAIWIIDHVSCIGQSLDEDDSQAESLPLQELRARLLHDDISALRSSRIETIRALLHYAEEVDAGDMAHRRDQPNT